MSNLCRNCCKLSFLCSKLLPCSTVSHQLWLRVFLSLRILHLVPKVLGLYLPMPNLLLSDSMPHLRFGYLFLFEHIFVSAVMPFKQFFEFGKPNLRSLPKSVFFLPICNILPILLDRALSEQWAMLIELSRPVLLRFNSNLFAMYWSLQDLFLKVLLFKLSYRISQ